MNKLYNNRFLFIISISIVFIMILTFGTIALTKKNTTEFEGAGYIISSNDVINFASGTSYRYNLSEQIVFTGENGKISEVNNDAIIHYANGSIALLKNGAFVDLNAINNAIVPYYNITSKSTITYKDGGYTIQNGSDTLLFEDILLRINENKYLVAGKNLKVKVSGIDEVISGNYFELTFIEDGIILVENDKVSYQVTADGTEVFVGNNIVLNLNNKNVSYNGKVMLNLTEVTIDGNENISIVAEESKESTTQSGSENNDGTNKPNTAESNAGGEETPGTESAEPIPVLPEDTEVSVELVKLIVNAENMTAIMQVNNPLKLVNDLEIKIINVKTSEEIIPTFSMTSTGYLSVYTDKLESDTNYMLRVTEDKNGDTIEYLQRMFTTDAYGINLKKDMLTENSISYIVEFSDQSKVTEVTVELVDSEGNTDDNNIKKITRDAASLNYINLNSNSEYTLRVTGFKIGTVTYINNSGYINKKVKTLKVKPTISGLNITTNENKTAFNINIVDLIDIDSAITKYNYYIYGQVIDEKTSTASYDEINPIYSKETTAPTLNLTIGENNIEANKNYKAKVIIEYNDNEKLREIETNFSTPFISNGAQVSFTKNSELTTFNTINGIIKLQDPDCTVPMEGRDSCPGTNSFTIAYYVKGNKYYKDITFEKTTDENVFVVNNFEITGLNANTEYTLELNGNIIEGTVVVPQTVIGKPFTVKTNDIDNLEISLIDTPKYDYDYYLFSPISATVNLKSNSSYNLFIEQVKTMKVTLYVLDASGNKTAIGNTVYLTNEQIISLLYNKNYTLTNKFFGIESLDALMKIPEAVDDSGNWIKQNYMISFTDAYDNVLAEVTENSNQIPIINGNVNTAIPRDFLLEYYAKKKSETNVKVSSITNSSLATKLENISDMTIVGYTLNAKIFIDDILRQYYGVSGEDSSINWDYKYYILDNDDNTVYTSNNTKSLMHTFYLDDETIENFDRGNEYKFGFQVVMSDTVYPSEIVIAEDEDGNKLFNPTKENPNIAKATWSSTAKTLTLMYKVLNDIDEAIYGNNIYLTDASGNIIDTEEISVSDEYQYVTFKNLSASSKYKLMYNKVNNCSTTDTDGNLTKACVDGFTIFSIGAIDFDGCHQVNGGTSEDGCIELQNGYTLDYSEAGNKLGIVINDINMVNRTMIYEVNLNSGSKSQKYLFEQKQLVKCTEDNLSNCMLIDYADLEEFMGANTKVTVNAYYDNGLVGIDQTSDYFVFKDGNSKYLTISPTGAISNSNNYSDGLYTFKYSSSLIKIKNAISNGEWNENLSEVSFPVTIDRGGMQFSYYGSFDAKVIQKSALTTSDDNFLFSSIIPMVETRVERNISDIKFTLNLSGLTKTLVENEFKNDNQKVYIDISEDDQFTDVTTVSTDIDSENPSNSLTINFGELTPNKTYYYKIYAYLLTNTGDYVKQELYDYRIDGIFEIRKKNTSTLSANEIIDTVDAAYFGESTIDKYMTRKIELTTNVKDLDNYSLTYEIVDSENTKVFENKEVTELTNSIVLDYDISNDNFVFGNSGYKLKITATTTDTKKNTLVLYEEDFVPHLKGDNSVIELRNPTITVTNKRSFVPSGANKYSISFNVAINDADLVIQNAEYYVKVTDDFGNSYTPEGYTLSDGYIKLNIRDVINPQLIYKNLAPDSYYTIEIKTTVHKNNYSLTEKTFDISAYEFIITGTEYNLTLGSGTLEVANNNLTINYNNASNLSNITKISATVRKNNALIGTYELTGSKLNFTNNSGNWALNIDLSDVATNITSEDNIRLVIRYYANNLNAVEGMVGTVTYANYEIE